MSNPYYIATAAPGTGSAGSSAVMRAEFALVAAGFDKLPSALTANKAVIVNSGGTAMTLTTGGLALAGDLSTTGAFNTIFAQQATVTLTLPAANGTLATLAGAETLTNKTLTAPSIGGTVSGGGTYSGITLSGNTTMPGSGQISSAGLVGIGMTPVNVLDITQSQNGSSIAAIKNANAGAAADVRLKADNGTSSAQLVQFGASFTTSGIFRQNGSVVYGNGAGGLTLATGAAQPVFFGVNDTEVGQVNSSRWYLELPLHIKPGSSVTPANNGDVVIEFTNNTTLTFKAKGSDGTVRSATLALS